MPWNEKLRNETKFSMAHNLLQGLLGIQNAQQKEDSMSNSIDSWLGRKKLNPFREFSQIEDSFDRLMNEMVTMRRGNQQPAFSPSCDITENTNQYILKFDLPGVSKDQIQVEVNRDQLVVHAERKDEARSEGDRKFLSEVFYGSYTRSFTLPSSMDEKKVDAKFENGVLTIVVPKSDGLKSKQIPVS